MLTGSSHCGAVHWQFDGMPEPATACNCTVCRRYGVLWIYDYEDQGIRVTGPTNVYIRNDKSPLGFHFCSECGCVTHWRGLQSNPKGHRRITVNVRLSEPGTIDHLLIDHFDGLNTFEDLPRNGRCVKDYWF